MKRLLLTTLALTLFVACDGRRRGGGGIIRVSCDDGDTRICTCPDQAQSSQTCFDGRFGACACDTTGTDGGALDGSEQARDGSVLPDTGVPDGGFPDTGMVDTGAPDSGQPGCGGDFECAPPATICENNQCVPGCANGGTPCNSPNVCDSATGRCMSAQGQACDVWNSSCPSGFVCTQQPGGMTTVCMPAGTAQLDQTCSPTGNNCAEGQGTCVDLGFGPRCYPGCDGAAPSCTDGMDVCWLVGTDWGVCDLFQQCDPINPNCPAGRSCAVVTQDFQTACIAAGSAFLGQDCTADGCASGQGICLNVGNGPICQEACDPNGVDTCSSGVCTALQNITWGVCT